MSLLYALCLGFFRHFAELFGVKLSMRIPAKADS